MAIEKILFPTNFRELSYSALEPLLVLKDAGLKEIILCHIILREDVGFVPFGGYMKDEEEKLREKARIRFEDWQKTITEKGIESRIIIKVGEPVPEIHHVARDEKADLIVVGRHKKMTIEDVFAGSDTLQIIQRSKVPVLVSKHMVQYEIDGDIHDKINDKIFQRPMLVTDWSEPCQRAMGLIKSLDKVIEKTLLFHDLESKVLSEHDKEEIQEIEDDRSDKLKAYCSILENGGVACEPHLGAGDLMDEIIRISRERKATMIIVGTSGKSRLSELLHGSISHEIAKKSELPTLLVP